MLPEEENYAVSKFESMLKENNILFFDVDEFEEIVEYYVEYVYHIYVVKPNVP